MGKEQLTVRGRGRFILPAPRWKEWVSGGEYGLQEHRPECRFLRVSRYCVGPHRSCVPHGVVLEQTRHQEVAQ